MDLLQDILVRPELEEFRSRISALEDRTGRLDDGQQGLGSEVASLREEMDAAIAQVINQMVDERFAQLETDWRQRIDAYFQEIFASQFQMYFQDHLAREWPKLAGRMAELLGRQLHRVNSRLDMLELQMGEVTGTLSLVLRSLQDISPDFQMGIRLAAVEQQLSGLTKNLASFAQGVSSDTLEAQDTLSDLRTMMVADGTLSSEEPFPEPPTEWSDAEVGVHLGIVEQDLGRLGNTVVELNAELSDRQGPFEESIALGGRLGQAEQRLSRLTHILTALIRELREQSSSPWGADSELAERLKNIEMELADLASRMVDLADNLPEPGDDEEERVSSSLSIRVKGVDPRWTAVDAVDEGIGDMDLDRDEDMNEEDWEAGEDVGNGEDYWEPEAAE